MIQPADHTCPSTWDVSLAVLCGQCVSYPANRQTGKHLNAG